MSRSLIHEAAAGARPVASRRGLSEWLFARLFEGLVYPQIWEDPVIDMEALEIGPDTAMVAIASGGCNVMSYLAQSPRRLIAVDLNHHHIALLKLKLAAARQLPDHADFHQLFGNADDAGNRTLYHAKVARALDAETRLYWDREIGALTAGFYRRGLLGRTIGAANLVARLHGSRLTRFLATRSQAEQRRVFDEEVAPLFRSPLVRLLFRCQAAYYGLGIPPAQLDAMRADAGGDLAATCEARLRRLFCDWPIASNYFAHQALTRRYDAEGSSLPPYLQPEHFAAIRAAAGAVEPERCSLTVRLAREDAQSLDAYVLLDAQDWMSPAQITALWVEICRTAMPGARVIFRTAAKASPLPAMLPAELLGAWRYEAERSRQLHAQDRSAIYDGFHLYRRDAR